MLSIEVSNWMCSRFDHADWMRSTRGEKTWDLSFNSVGWESLELS